jgi:adenosylcobinamide-GDP ribazoletransferase
VNRAGRAGLAAITFLTVLPLGRRIALDGEDVARGSVLFPLVGAGIGAASGGTVWLLGDQLPPLLAAVLGVVVTVALTGALHLDGLADCADGFGARTIEDRLRVMRDHTNGTYGGSALLLDLMIRAAALSAVAGTSDALLFSIAAGALSRTVGTVLAARLPYAQARPGAGEALNANPSESRAWWTCLVGAAIAFAALRDIRVWSGTLLVGFLTVVLVARTTRRRLGGVTGDVMGACSELVELAVLVVLVATV